MTTKTARIAAFLVALLICAIAVRMVETRASAQAASGYGDSVITNGTSGLYILQNGPEDFSLKIVSGDGTKNVTVVRRAGRTAKADVELAYQLWRAQLLMMGLKL